METATTPATVLVVEDEALVNWNIADALRDDGFCVVQAFSGEQALSIVEKRQDIRLVFADVNLPGEIDGIALVASVQKHSPHIEVLLTSAFNRERLDKLDVVKLFGRFVPKPYPLQAVVRRIHEIIDGSVNWSRAHAPS
jgi:two-component system, response regulator PdtaR